MNLNDSQLTNESITDRSHSPMDQDSSPSPDIQPIQQQIPQQQQQHQTQTQPGTSTEAPIIGPPVNKFTFDDENDSPDDELAQSLKQPFEETESVLQFDDDPNLNDVFDPYQLTSQLDDNKFDDDSIINSMSPPEKSNKQPIEPTLMATLQNVCFPPQHSFKKSKPLPFIPLKTIKLQPKQVFQPSNKLYIPTNPKFPSICDKNGVPIHPFRFGHGNTQKRKFLCQQLDYYYAGLKYLNIPYYTLYNPTIVALEFNMSQLYQQSCYHLTYKHKYDMIKQQLTQLRRVVNAKSSVLNTVQVQQDLQKENESLLLQLSSEKRHRNDLERRHNNLLQFKTLHEDQLHSNNELEAINSKLRSKFDKYKKQAHQKVLNLKQDIQKLQHECNEHIKQNKELMNNNNKLDADLAELSHVLDQRETENKNYISKYQKLKSQLNNFKNKFSELKKKSNDKIQHANGVIKKLHNEKIELENAMQKLTQLNHEYHTKNQTLQKELLADKSQITHLQHIMTTSKHTTPSKSSSRPKPQIQEPPDEEDDDFDLDFSVQNLQFDEQQTDPKTLELINKYRIKPEPTTQLTQTKSNTQSKQPSHHPTPTTTNTISINPPDIDILGPTETTLLSPRNTSNTQNLQNNPKPNKNTENSLILKNSNKPPNLQKYQPTHIKPMPKTATYKLDETVVPFIKDTTVLVFLYHTSDFDPQQFTKDQWNQVKNISKKPKWKFNINYILWHYFENNIIPSLDCNLLASQQDSNTKKNNQTQDLLGINDDFNNNTNITTDPVVSSWDHQQYPRNN